MPHSTIRFRDGPQAPLVHLPERTAENSNPTPLQVPTSFQLGPGSLPGSLSNSVSGNSSDFQDFNLCQLIIFELAENPVSDDGFVRSRSPDDYRPIRAIQMPFHGYFLSGWGD